MSSLNGHNGRDQQLASVWEAYKSEPTEQLRNTLLVAYQPLVRCVAERLVATLPSFVDVEELASIGIFGLCEAIERFDLSLGVKFKTYAMHRIRGAILDELREQDWVPRLVRIKATKIERCCHELEAELGREPTFYEMAQRFGIAFDEYHSMIEGGSATAMISLSEEWTDQEDNHGNRKIDLLEDRRRDSAPDFPLRNDDVVRIVGEVLGEGSDAFIVIYLYYLEEKSMKEIAELLSRTESRVCQIHGESLIRLKEQLVSFEELS